MLGDDTIKASVNSSIRHHNRSSNDLYQTNNVNQPDATVIAPMDFEASQERDLHRLVSYMSPTSSQKEWEMSSIKTEEITEDNVPFYEDISLQPLDLTKGDIDTPEDTSTETIGSYDENPSVPEMTTVSLAKYNYRTIPVHSTSSQNYFNDDFGGTSNSFTCEPQSFLSLVNDEDLIISMTSELENLSKEPAFRAILEPNPPPALYPGTHDLQKTNITDLQVIQPRMPISNNENDEDDEDDYTKLQNIICTLLSTPKSAKMKLKTIAEGITDTYKCYDQFPEGFFDSLADIQRNFLVRIRNTTKHKNTNRKS